ncbi:MAG: hypothetical protein HZB52_08130 [Chloroflexi bacterium]|nr:hypothetical protein [Chloroflexota bacterium]
MNTPVRVTSWLLFGIAGLIFGACLAGGILWYGSTNSLTSSNGYNPTQTAQAYKNFLLIQVDSTQKDKSTIQSIWLLRFPANRAATFEIFTFHPSIFRGKGGISQDILQPYVIGTINGTVVFDRADLSDYVDRLGGITVASQQMNGAGVWQYLDTADVNYPNDLAIRQAAVAHSILLKMAAMNGRVDLNALFGHNASQTSQAEFLALLQSYYPSRADSFRVHLVNPS